MYRGVIMGRNDNDSVRRYRRNIADRLERWRQKQKPVVTQQEIADLLGISDGTVNRAIKHPERKMTDNIIVLLDAKIPDVFRGSRIRLRELQDTAYMDEEDRERKLKRERAVQERIAMLEQSIAEIQRVVEDLKRGD